MIPEKEQIDNLHIVHYPHPVLRQVADEIRNIDQNIEQLVLKMIELMYQNRGVGLAANQVGIPLRLFVANPTGERGKELVFINPQIVETNGWAESEEGCLSVPQIQTNIRRQQKVTVRAIDLKEHPFEVPAEGLLARIVQHENDHINGKTILDRMSRIARMAHRRQIKYLEQHSR